MTEKSEKATSMIKQAISSKDADHFDLKRIQRLILAFLSYGQYFLGDRSSAIADKLEHHIRYMSIDAPGGRVSRLLLYAFDGFYKNNGATRTAKELERVRRLMRTRARFIHARYDRGVRAEIAKLILELARCESDKEREGIKASIKTLNKFFNLPGDLEIKDKFRLEIETTLAARHPRSPIELNRPPEDGLFRVAIRDVTVEGYLRDGMLELNLVPHNPDHLLTFAVNASISDVSCMVEAEAWWDYTQRVFGYEGALTFYEFVGFLLITRFPLPCERTIMYILGQSGIGKGTHLTAVASLLTLGASVLYAKVGPHKLADEHEHFSHQNLMNVMALIDGDISHRSIKDFSAVNNVFGGEPIEVEKKYKDPVSIIPTFKSLWSSTPPVHRIHSAGGAWRRILLIVAKAAGNEQPDAKIKPKMLSALDGFFFNALVGLSYLVTADWHFAGELPDDQLQELWELQSDSIAVWVREVGLTPAPETVEKGKNGLRTINDDGGEAVEEVENEKDEHPVDELYGLYCTWCSKLQISPMGGRTFTRWLNDHGFLSKRKKIGERRLTVFYASFAVPLPFSETDTEDGTSDIDRISGSAGYGTGNTEVAQDSIPFSDLLARSKLRFTGLVPDPLGKLSYITNAPFSAQPSSSRDRFAERKWHEPVKSETESPWAAESAPVVATKPGNGVDSKLTAVERCIHDRLRNARGTDMELGVGALMLWCAETLGDGVDTSLYVIKAACEHLKTFGLLRERDGRYSYAGGGDS